MPDASASLGRERVGLRVGSGDGPLTGASAGGVGEDTPHPRPLPPTGGEGEAVAANYLVRLSSDELPLAVLHHQVHLVLRLALARLVEGEGAGHAREALGPGHRVADGVAVGAGLLDGGQDD